MPENTWNELLMSLEITDSSLCPSSVADLDLFETETGFTLPVSYRGYCMVFGPGELVRPDSYRIAVPGPPELGAVELRQFNRTIRELCTDYEQDWPDDPDQYRRAWFFGTDIGTAWYFWDPRDVTDHDKNECGIYIMYRERRIERLADTFWDFVTKICLETGVPGYVNEEPIERVFQPFCPKRSKKKHK